MPHYVVPHQPTQVVHLSLHWADTVHCTEQPVNGPPVLPLMLTHRFESLKSV